MAQAPTVKFSRSIKSVRVLDNHTESPSLNVTANKGAAVGIKSGGGPVDAETGMEQNPTQDLEAQRAAFSQASRMLSIAAAQLGQFCEKIFGEHAEEIARLSVEIAKKILVQKVQNGDYKIEAIVKEALKNAPTRQDVVVHLNPEDLAECQKAQEEEPAGALSGIKFVPDPNIGRAECVVESPKGIIQSLINEHLERVAKALKKTE